ncbi:udp-n-acetylmuramate--l-alanine ligase [Lactobacillus selangorensis]|uniref:UDP-N-acetylmuramate--L-alanine ligase n=1 Tax=Lactobacillus selangorensis TaxID=81857 RepID=A0A0R2FMF8_9LACO|nr:UDP-N-acetylmuramate--L-alanine ligase [Lactobacillus selangorensis]KRN29746.1 udp-n-acetylmuramate--l-alanine ligase [Lactobacillus selangorensis]KRN33725.1 udp-n-acetylmuramate--l-alanine ligase [Lactobacillus selangorensis]
MAEKELSKDKTYYFVGIKGSGMASLALLLHDLGYQVEGSDITQYTFTQKGLEDANIKIYPFNKDNLHAGLFVIAGNAFDDDQEEIKAARAMGLPVMRYHEFLGKFMQPYTSIGVAGTHGKTSTSGLLAHVLSGVAKTSYLIGDGSGKGVPNSRFFVFEADEYRRHFLAYHPDYMIMTNIDFDHPDYYKDIEDVYQAFETEANQTQKAVLAWGDDKNLRRLKADVPIYYYGTSDKDDFQAVNIERTTAGSSFDVMYKGESIGRYETPLYGKHGVLNSTAVIAVAYLEGIPSGEVARELRTFGGVKRRFAVSTVGDMTIIDDYAHHPTEIEATLDAARQKFPDKKIIAVFQPHTYSRTLAFLDGFTKALDKADEVYITPIFGSARESSGKVSAADLAKKIIPNKSKGVLHQDDLTSLLQEHNAVVVFMGAGDIQKYETAYKKALEQR